jgi:hypothetical protein
MVDRLVYRFHLRKHCMKLVMAAVAWPSARPPTADGGQWLAGGYLSSFRHGCHSGVATVVGLGDWRVHVAASWWCSRVRRVSLGGGATEVVGWASSMTTSGQQEGCSRAKVFTS